MTTDTVHPEKNSSNFGTYFIGSGKIDELRDLFFQFW